MAPRLPALAPAASRTRDDTGTTIRFRIFSRQGGGTGVRSEGGPDSGQVYESLVLAGLALPSRRLVRDVEGVRDCKRQGECA